MAELRKDRLARTRANGGIAPIDTHTYVTYSVWGCRCPVCVEDYQQEKNRRRREPAAAPGHLRRRDITVDKVLTLIDAGLSVSQIMAELRCSRDVVTTRLLHAQASHAPTGRRIRVARKATGQTLAQVAQRCGVSVATLSRVESGRRALRGHEPAALAAALGVTQNHLVSGE